MVNVIFYEIIQRNEYNLQKLVDCLSNYFQDNMQGLIINDYDDFFLNATYWYKKKQKSYQFNVEKKDFDIVETEIIEVVDFGIELKHKQLLIFGNKQMAQRIITMISIVSKAIKTQDYFIEQPTKTKEGACLQLSYIRKLPGRNRLLEEERRYLRLNIRKITNEEVVVDVRQQSATDSKNALGFIEKIAQSDENIGIRHINLEMLSSKNKVEFFDRIAAYKFKVWDLKTITGITVKQGLLDESEEEDIIVEDGEHASTLTGISQAVLNGSGLRSNEFVQESIKKGYYISAMRYRYTHKTDITEFAIVLSFKNQDLRVDIDKTYYEEDDGRIYVQPLIKTEQNEIIIAFQDVAYKVYNELISEQLVESTKLKS